MIHEIYYVDGFKIVRPYTLEITFDDSSTQVINFEPLLRGELFGPLRDLTVFNQVRLDAEIRNLVWPNDAAFDPETLRNWPRYRKTMIEMAQQWERVPAIPV
jgi:hypothetical protein